jgi:hypothetical protein
VGLGFELTASYLHTGKADTLPLEPQLLSFLLWLFGDGISQTIFSGFALNLDLPISASCKVHFFPARVSWAALRRCEFEKAQCCGEVEVTTQCSLWSLTFGEIRKGGLLFFFFSNCLFFLS